MATIDLSLLPAPKVLEDLSYEAILADMKATAIGLMPELEPALRLESEPASKVLQVCAVFVMLTRARVNDGAKAVMPAYATGSDLDNLAALLGVQRLVVDAGDANAVPPIPPTYESDADFRARFVSAPEGFSVAGPNAAYEFHARSASGLVRDVAVDSPEPGLVRLVVQSTAAGGGVAPSEVLAAVEAAVTAETVRPLCDTVLVTSVAVVPFEVAASIEVLSGPDSASVLDAASAALAAYLDSCNRIGRAVRLSGIYAALHQSGVARVILAAPTADLEPTAVQTAFCASPVVTVA